MYHHFRVLGWVVRAGYTLGADWQLYKTGPAFHHASYTVRVEGVPREAGAESVEGVAAPPLTWRQVLGLVRVAAAVRKELLVARVAAHADRRDWASPHCLHAMAVTVARVRRWLPGEHRWTTKPTVPTTPAKTRVKEKASKKEPPEVEVKAATEVEEEEVEAVTEEAVIVLD